MTRISDVVASPVIRAWVNAFFENNVDTGRLRRGYALYRAGALLTFEESDRQFYAEVQGSQRNPYTLVGRCNRIASNGDVDISTLHITCFCPDSVPLCKHGVCAVLHWAVLIDRRLRRHALNPAEKRRAAPSCHPPAWNSLAPAGGQADPHPLSQLDEQRERLERQLASDGQSLLHLNNPAFWPFEERLHEVMAEIHRLVGRNVKHSGLNRRYDA